MRFFVSEKEVQKMMEKELQKVSGFAEKEIKRLSELVIDEKRRSEAFEAKVNILEKRLMAIKISIDTDIDSDNNLQVLTAEERWERLMELENKAISNFSDRGFMKTVENKIKRFAVQNPGFKTSVTFHGGCHGCTGPKTNGLGYCKGCTYFDSWRDGVDKNTKNKKA